MSSDIASVLHPIWFYALHNFMSSMMKTYPAKDNSFGYVVLFLSRFEPMTSEE